MKHKPDKNSAKIQKLIRKAPRTARPKLRAFLKERAEAKYGLTHALHGHATKALRRSIVTAFKLK